MEEKNLSGITSDWYRKIENWSSKHTKEIKHLLDDWNWADNKEALQKLVELKVLDEIGRPIDENGELI